MLGMAIMIARVGSQKNPATPLDVGKGKVVTVMN
jgi:hypothetical protein